MAQTLHIQGKQLARHPGQHQAAKESSFKAVSVFHTLEDRRGEAESLRAWAHLDIAEGDFQSALKHLDKAIALFDDDSHELELMVELYRLRANCHARTKSVIPPVPVPGLQEAGALQRVRVRVGGAVVFIADVEQFVRC